MKLLTFAPKKDEKNPRIGALLGDEVVDLPLLNEIWRKENSDSTPLPTDMKDYLSTGDNDRRHLTQLLSYANAKRSLLYGTAILNESDIIYFPPITNAERFFCVGKNYKQHLEELRKNDLILETPQEPTAFIKLNSCLSGHDGNVERPNGIVRLDYEPELVFVLGRHAYGVKKKDAFGYVAGITILNDLTCRDLQKREVASGSRFWTGKNIPGFGPLGPCIVTMDEIKDPYDLWMTCSVNGEERMHFNTRDQIWKLPSILEHFTRFIPFEPGDMFATGTPGGTAIGKPNADALFLKPGDVVECAIDGIMTLRTKIVAPSH